MTTGVFNVLRDPSAGEKSIAEFSKPENSQLGPTGILSGPSGEFPVLSGVAIFRQDLITNRVLRYAREGKTNKALFEALKLDTQSKRDALDLIIRLRVPRLLQSNGSPYAAMTGPAGTYFRYRYSIPNVPAIFGVLSCLRRTGSEKGFLIDVGAGFGHFYRYYLHAYSPDKIILVDHSLQALVTASRFVDRKTLLVCCDAEASFPFERGIASDITSFNAFQYLKKKEAFIKTAIETLDPSTGTLWLTNNWNPTLTKDFFGPARSPSEWRQFCGSPAWRIYPETHFAEPILRGGLVNLAVDYIPTDDEDRWRSVTLAYSNASWNTNNKFVPVNRAPRWRYLNINSIYRRSLLRDQLVKRQAAIKLWEVHREYYGFRLPERVAIPGRINRDTGRSLQALAESLMMVETLSPRRREVVAELLSPHLSRLRESLSSWLTKCRFKDAAKPLIPRFLKAKAKQLLDVQKTY
jgi:hypothetical protein